MSNTKPEKVNLFDLADTGYAKPSLEIVKLGSDETALIPFTSDTEAVVLHYCQETEIAGYAVCNGSGCVLCRVGRKQDERLLLPVYLPTSESIGILPLSRSLRPYALLPQLLNVLKAKNPMVMFVRREGGKYLVSTVDLKPDAEGGELAMKQFLSDYEANNYDLASLYPQYSNEQLTGVEEISRMLALKEGSRNADHQRA